MVNKNVLCSGFHHQDLTIISKRTSLMMTFKTSWQKNLTHNKWEYVLQNFSCNVAFIQVTSFAIAVTSVTEFLRNITSLPVGPLAPHPFSVPGVALPVEIAAVFTTGEAGGVHRWRRGTNGVLLAGHIHLCTGETWWLSQASLVIRVGRGVFGLGFGLTVASRLGSAGRAGFTFDANGQLLWYHPTKGQQGARYPQQKTSKNT